MAAWCTLEVFLCVAAIVPLVVSDPQVSTNVGDIIGVRVEAEFDGRMWTVDKFLGIPYAEAPVGELRFRKPVPKAPFDKPFEAKAYGHSCLQVDYPGLPSVGSVSEDCLSLNIFVPAEASKKPPSGYPVMVFIHGGGFMMGSSNTYPSDILSDFGEVIVVTINYRLGMLGFLSTGSEEALGNFGLWDQHLAFQWVHKHILAFGGDNKKVTIFGESAGSMSVALQSLFPENIGLFQRALGQSGATNQGMFTFADLTVSRFLANEFKCGLPEDPPANEIVDCLRRVTNDEILTKMTEWPSDPEKAVKLRFLPTVDGDFLKEPLSSVLELKDSQGVSPQETMFASINFMIGVNLKEGGVFIGPATGVEDIENYIVERATMDTMLIPFVLGITYPTLDTSALRDLVSAQYTDWGRPDDPEALRDQHVDMIGDAIFVEPSITLARKHANLTKAGSTYFYHFCTEPSVHLLPTGTWLKGANHGDELGFVFGFSQEMVDILSREKEIVIGSWEIQHAKTVMTLWTNFAKSGDPNQPVDVSQDIGTQWPAFDTHEERYFEINREMSAESVKGHLRAEAVNFWSKLIPGLIRATGHQGEQPANKYKSDGATTCSSPDSCSP